MQMVMDMIMITMTVVTMIMERIIWNDDDVNGKDHDYDGAGARALLLALLRPQVRPALLASLLVRAVMMAVAIIMKTLMMAVMIMLMMVVIMMGMTNRATDLLSDDLHTYRATTSKPRAYA